ncbi:MAG: bifunctional oligoribonuclease/PAP phosphatase NrnA [Calditrichaeota bacterium]|nr:bifunctional oligoribonuclease/PAP phosphatase NrnA [Calditrichota bacterium]MCB9368349.1 bifunctional oligoribonuclease/PAP phosphatase NrnA [Calditrichota bacterium]
MKFSSAEIAALRPFLESPRVLISAHVRPDPDAIGSVLALREAVLQCGGTPVCVMEDECPTRCTMLFGASEIVTLSGTAGLKPFDDVIVVDSGNRERIGDVESLVSKSARIANLDHHISNTKFGHVNLVDTDASASGELLFDLFEELKVSLTATMATNLLAGILTDTGRFRHSNTTPKTLRVAANLVEAGAKISELTEQLYYSIPAKDVRSTAQILSTLELHAEGRISTMFVPLDYVVEDPDNLVDLGRAIDGVEVAVLFSEMDDGRIRVSLRSKSIVNVSAIAESFGGGGHERAAGFRMYGTLRSVQARLLPSLMHALDQAK